MMGEIPKRSAISDVKQLAQYVYQLEDQLRYALSHLGSENISPGGITGESLAAESVKLENLSKGIRQTFVVDNSQVISALEDMQGTVSLLRQSIAGLETRVVNAETVVDGYDTRMTQAESSITQQAGQIAAKVSQTEYNTDKSGIEQRLSTAETAITQKADSITLTALREQVDGISIGGRNLLPDSEQEIETERFISIEVGDILGPYVGESVCVSFEALGAIARDVLVYPYQDSGVSIKDQFTFTMPTDTFKRFSFVTEVKDFETIVGENTGKIGFYDRAGTQEYTIRRVKIELGNMPTDWTPDPDDAAETLENTVVRIDTQGVTMRGGVMDFQAGSEFKVRSGGVFNVFATDDESVIRFGGTEQSPNFSLGAGGNVKAKKITAEELEVTGGGSLPTLLSGSLASQFIVADTQPSGHGILWMQPGGGGGGTVDFVLSASGGEDMSGGSPSRTLTGFTRQGSALSGGTCSYGVRFRIYNYAGACWLYRMTAQIQRGDGTGNAVTIFDRNYRALEENIRVGVGDYFELDTLNSPAAGLENLTDAGNLKLIVTMEKSDSTSARFEVGQPFTIRATGGQSGSAQACSLYYIP